MWYVISLPPEMGKNEKVGKNVKQQEFVCTAGRSTQTTFEVFESGLLVRFIISSILYLKENKNSNMKTD